MYLIKENKPYYYDGKKVYPCEITKDYAKVDFSNTVDSFPFNCIYTLSEIKKLLLDNAESASSISMESKPKKRTTKSTAKKG